MTFDTKYRWMRKAAFFFATLLLAESFIPSTLALSGGPSQPEAEYFSPVSSDNMVDLFTGNFGYSIPLLDVGGYPLTLTYNSGVTMMDEASFVGLGWSLNTGVMQRNMRGIPDDFKGDEVKQEFNRKANHTFGIDGGVDLEVFGISAMTLAGTASAGLFYNTYRGLGVNISYAPTLSFASDNYGSATASMGVNASSFGGIGLNTSIGISHTHKTDVTALSGSISGGFAYGSREGMRSAFLNLGAGVKTQRQSRNDRPAGAFSRRFSHGGSYSFAHPTHVPMMRFPMESISLSYAVKIGAELFGAFPAGRINASYNYQGLRSNEEVLPAYGYVYAENAKGRERVMMDFNREKDGPFTPDSPVLPMGNFTYDTYSANGPGLSGSFRPHRGDVAQLYESRVSHTGLEPGGAGSRIELPSLTASVEVGAGNAFHLGVDLLGTMSSSTSKGWDNDNEIKDLLNFKSTDSSYPAYEPVYFRNGSEITPLNEQIYAATGGDAAVYVGLEGSSTVAKAGKVLRSSDGDFSVNQPVFMQDRQSRNQLFSYLTASEAAGQGLQRAILSYPLNDFTADPDTLLRNENAYQPHHFSEISVANEQGLRYVYGVPAYNHYQKDVTFNVAGRSADCATGLVNYQPGDNSIENSRGIDHYYHATHLPGYAHSFLLTAILSPDYVDLTGDGPTPDDHGSYTLFNYTRVMDDYKWRIPSQENKASYQPGNLTDQLDDKGHYIYGEKEIWYLHSIETKNYVAQFVMGTREDGLEVKGENGGANTSDGRRLKKLERIDLFTKAGLEAGEPLKSVHFEYDYSLNPGLPNAINNQGKLTLRKVYFTYGNSLKGEEQKYEFEYGGANFAFNAAHVDMWGNYKEEDCSVMPADEFPYTRQQNREQADANAAPWSLRTIKLPSGGRIEVEYEAGDYAYVQDRRAMQMLHVAGFGNDPGGLPQNNNNRLYEGSQQDYRTNEYLYFELKEALPSGSPGAAMLREYVEGVDELYFNLHTDVVGEESFDGRNFSYTYENIDGFIPVKFEAFGQDFGFDESSADGNGNYTRGWIRLPQVPVGDDRIPVGLPDKVHPMAHFIWQHLKNYRPDLAYKSPRWDDNYVQQLVSGFTSIVSEFVSLLTGLNQQLLQRMVGSEVMAERSYIRLNVPDKVKTGGPARVKRVLMFDAWDELTGGANKGMMYGREYIYTANETLDGEQRVISSGVASWEPAQSFENPFKYPFRYTEDGESRYVTRPFGESFFPAPVVGYSKVKMRNLQRDIVQKTAAGHSEHRFFTAKDFPVIVEMTDIDFKHHKPGFLGSFKWSYKEFMTASQGFLVELNDMHGKPRSEMIFQEGSDVPISGAEFHYRTDGRKLNSRVAALDNAGNVVDDVLMGVDYELVLDTREEISESKSYGLEMNTDGFLAFIVPVIIPIPIPRYNTQEVQFRSISATKLIKRRGLLEKVTTVNNGARLDRETIAWDKQTGRPLVYRQQNEYGISYYETNIPAYWEYSGMAPGYHNVGMSFEDVQFDGQTGRASMGSDAKLLQPGDEVLLQRQGRTRKAWVLNSGNDFVTLIRQNGNYPPSGVYSIKVLRSGSRNQQALNTGKVISMVNPLQSGMLEFEDVVEASATEFSEQWQSYLGMNISYEPDYCDCEEITAGHGYYHVQLYLEQMADTILHSPRTIFGSSDGVFNIWKSEISGNRLSGSFVSNVDATGMKYPDEEQCKLSLRVLNANYFPPAGGVFENFRPADRGSSCDILWNFKVDYVVPQGRITKTYEMEGTNSCWPLAVCRTVPPEVAYHCDLPFGDAVNPWFLGIRGSFRPLAEYMYIAQRKATGRVADDGVYESFEPFWNLLPGADPSKWIAANSYTKIDPFGTLLEEKDALGRYASELKGFNNNLVVATAANARHNQIAFDSFEDWHYSNRDLNEGECEFNGHLQGMWKTSSGSALAYHSGLFDKEKGHTGSNSIRVASILHFEYDIALTPDCNTIASTSASDKYLLQPCDLAGEFNPDPGHYTLSVWTKDRQGSAGNGYVRVLTQGNVAGEYNFYAESLPVDGWRKIEGHFEIPQGTNNLKIQLRTTSGMVLFDDFRVHPFNSQMQSYVFDPVTLRLKAVLDENNYATFYEYDEEGNLVTIKRETDEGIITLQESYRSLRKR